MKDRHRILNLAQGDLPLRKRPFSAWANEAGLSEEDLLRGLRALKRDGVVRRFGGVFDARAMGWITTLVGAVAPRGRLDDLHVRMKEHPGVTHAYVRDHRINVWFTLAVKTDGEISAFLEALREEALADQAWSMPQKRRFKLDVRFDAGESGAAGSPSPSAGETKKRGPAGGSGPVPGSGIDRELVRALQGDLEFRPDLFQALAERIGIALPDVLDRLQTWKEQKALKRIGAVVRHRRVGFAHNAMVAARVPAGRIEEAGRAVARLPFVSHAYERETPPDFPFGLFAMVHARSAEALSEAVDAVKKATGADDLAVLQSVRELKKESMTFVP